VIVWSACVDVGRCQTRVDRETCRQNALDPASQALAMTKARGPDGARGMLGLVELSEAW